jgi:seryl-tRNA synthetase
MLDIKLIRENTDTVRQMLKNRGDDSSLEEILKLDQEYLEALQESEVLRAKRNDVSKQISKMKDKPQELVQEMRQVGNRIAELEAKMTQLMSDLNQRLLRLPNMLRPDVPLGTGSEDNKVIATWGEIKKFDFKPQPHWDLAEKLDIIDFARGVKLSGTRFYVLKGLGAKLQRSVIQFMLDTHTQKHGYKEIYPPFMVKEECMIGSSNLPKFADNLYHDVEDNLWFVPTAEVPLTNMHRDEILSAELLPIHYVAYTACFRREKMAAGKDTRGIKRGHQFDKVELYKFCDPEKSTEELESLRADAEDICQKLGLPYHVLLLCTGDIGFASAKSYDLEMWAPGCEEWLEVSSCSVCDDFQARRANIRYRPDPKAKPRFVHTLNGSGLALPRVMISILENYQRADGHITVPEVLRPYMGTEFI